MSFLLMLSQEMARVNDFAMNSEEDNNSDSMNVGEVLSSLDFVLFVHLCIIII